ncbi:MAG TPA: hypothetical protein PLS84_04275 [Salinivirgaceae bacterium]|jgi:uncharacterized membrane protein (DUF4010 family)|nr:hypothetical protein [Salinivirgaceae bacterium]
MKKLIRLIRAIYFANEELFKEIKAGLYFILIMGILLIIWIILDYQP